MNIKLQQKDVYCLLENYEKVYSIITSHTGVIGLTFCKRLPGSGYLQWTLPPGDWVPISNASESERNLIKEQYSDVCRNVSNLFGSNKKLAHEVLTVPSDNYVFYRVDECGDFCFALTAWGYKFPEKHSGKIIHGKANPPVEYQLVRLCFVYDGKKLPNYTFILVSFHRKTDKDGIFNVGSYPIGGELSLGLEDGRSFSLNVEKGKELYEFDITEYVVVEIKAHKDGNPYAEVSCKVDYNGRSTILKTDSLGVASVSYPYSLSGSDCVVTLNDKIQSKPASCPKTSFFFDIVTPPLPPESEKESEEDSEDNPIKEPEPPQEKKEEIAPEPPMVRFLLKGYGGSPLPNLEFTVKTKKSGVLKGVTNSEGYAEFPANLFINKERPKIKFTITKEYQEKHDIHAKH